MRRLLRAGRQRASKKRRRSDLPVLAVDIDGVVVLFGFDEPPTWPGAEFELIDGKMRCISAHAGECLRRLSRHFEVIWATGWEGRAAQIGSYLGLPDWPYLDFGGRAEFGSADWKLEPLARYACGRPLAWIDDSLDERCYEWARAREEPTLLIETESELGLQGVQEEVLTVWARGFEAGLEKRDEDPR